MDHGNAMANSIMEDVVKPEKGIEAYISNYTRNTVASKCNCSIFNIKKDFLADFFMGSKYFWGNGVKIVGGNGQKVLSPKCFSIKTLDLVLVP